MSYLNDYANIVDDERCEAAKAAYLNKLAEILDDPVQIAECLTGQYTLSREAADARLRRIAEYARIYMLANDSTSRVSSIETIGFVVAGMLVPDMDYLCRDYAEAEWMDYAERELAVEQ